MPLSTFVWFWGGSLILPFLAGVLLPNGGRHAYARVILAMILLGAGMACTSPMLSLLKP